MNKSNSRIYGIFALFAYIGLMVGFGFILDLFWKISKQNSIIFWVSTGIVCLCVVFYVIITLFGNKDKGVGAIQLFFTVLLSFIPIIVRLINMIPNAGIYISIVLLFVVISTYIFSMLSMGYYATDINKNSDRPGGREI